MAKDTTGRLHVTVKSGGKRKLSSKLWLERQLNDPYVAKARAMGYRSRAAFKLLEIDDKYRLLKPGMTVVDLGAAPEPPKKNAQSLSQDTVQQLVREGKMRWDDVDQRYVAVEVVEEARIGIQAVSIGNEDLSSKAPEVQQAILERRQALQDAQEEKRARLRAQRSAAESEADAQITLKAQLDPQLKRWSEDHGKKKNIRALLAGMDQVMWEGSGWKPISIGDLLEPKKVKRAYYKASRFVHPDKLVNLSVEQRFVGKRIFDALSQAYAEFEESGMG